MLLVFGNSNYKLVNKGFFSLQLKALDIDFYSTLMMTWLTIEAHNQKAHNLLRSEMIIKEKTESYMFSLFLHGHWYHLDRAFSGSHHWLTEEDELMLVRHRTFSIVVPQLYNWLAKEGWLASLLYLKIELYSWVFNIISVCVIGPILKLFYYLFFAFILLFLMDCYFCLRFIIYCL